MPPTAALVIAFAALRAPVEPPEATFTLADDRLTVRVTDAGKPLAGVGVRCLVGTKVWTTVDTDADGRANLPRPPKDWCQVVCDLGNGPMAPIPLTLLPPDEVVPKSYPVLDGAAECCLMPYGSPVEMPPTRPEPSILPELLGLGLGTLVAGLAFAVWRWRTARRTA